MRGPRDAAARIGCGSGAPVSAWPPWVLHRRPRRSPVHPDEDTAAEHRVALAFFHTPLNLFGSRTWARSRPAKDKHLNGSTRQPRERQPERTSVRVYATLSGLLTCHRLGRRLSFAGLRWRSRRRTDRRRCHQTARQHRGSPDCTPPRCRRSAVREIAPERVRASRGRMWRAPTSGRAASMQPCKVQRRCQHCIAGCVAACCLLQTEGE